jgi:thioesterase DpgC
VARSAGSADVPGADPVDELLRHDVASIYEELTDELRRHVRVSELVYSAAERFPSLVPSRSAIDAERQLAQKDKQGLEIAQGAFVSRVLAHPRSGFHLMHSMSQPKAEALDLVDGFRRQGSVDLGPMRVDRQGTSAT